MPSWKKVIISGSDAVLNTLIVTNGITGSLFGTASWAVSASYISPSTTNAFIQGGNSFGTTALLGTNDNQPLALETSGSERMRITSAGDVGIGTTTPYGKLVVNNGADRNLFITSDSLLGGTTGMALASLLDSTADYMPLTLLGSKISIKATGGVLINTITDNGVDKLQVNGSLRAGKIKGSKIVVANDWWDYTSGSTALYITDANGTIPDGESLAVIRGYGELPNPSNYLLSIIQSGTNTSSFSVSSTGVTRADKILINTFTDNGVDKLQVNGSVNSADYRSTDTLFLTADGDNTGTNPIVFRNGPSGELARITSAGNVGIGTTSPEQKLKVLNPFENEYFGTDSSQPASAMNLVGTGVFRGLGTGSALLFSVPANTDGSNVWAQARILGTGDNNNNGDANGALFLQTRANYNPGVGGSWNWRTNMVLRASGNVGIGTTTPSEKLEVSGTLRITNISDPTKYNNLATDTNGYLSFNNVVYQTGIGSGNGYVNLFQNYILVGSSSLYGFTSTNNSGPGALDAAISRLSPAKLAVGNGTNGNTSGTLVASAFSGSLFGTSSWAVSASWAPTPALATTASYALTASYANYALTASNSQNAQDILIYVKNVTGTQINKGKVVRISGATGDNALISTASYESDPVSANTLGITTTDIANDSFGYAITEGTLLGINTDAFSAGQLLYLGATGSIIGTAPVAPLHGVRLGQVLRVQAINGSMYVRIDNGYELGELHDIIDSTTTSSYGDLLVKSGSVWVNSKQLTGSYGVTGSLNVTAGITGSLFGTSSNVQGGTANYIPIWNTATSLSSSAIYQSAGNVGIGTTDPGQKLEIVGGNVLVTSAAPYLSLKTTQTGTPDWKLYNSYDVVGDFAAVGAVGVAFKILPNGNVGIGTTSPGDKLEVNGNIFANGFNSIGTLTRYNSGGGVAMLGLAGNAYATIQAYSDAGGTGKYLAINPNGGNVGIGTVSPNTKLQVSALNSDYVNLTAGLSVVKMEEGYGMYMGVAPSGNSWIQSATYDNGTKYPLILNGAGGNVGIGTTSPGFKLQVSGAVHIGNSSVDASSYSNGMEIVNSTSSPTSLFLFQAGVGSGHIGLRSNDTNLYIVNSYSDGLITNPSAITLTSAGNVGIGTTTPSDKLQVSGGGILLDYDAKIWSRVGTGTGVNAELVLFDGAGDTFLTNRYFTGNLFFRTSTTNNSPQTRMTITPAGNVGIGTTSPSNKLDVSGSIRATQYVYANDAFVGDAIVSVGNVDLNINKTTAYSIVLSTSGSEKMRIDSAGNVGIGTSSPTAKLNIKSDGTAGWLKLETTSGNPVIESAAGLSFTAAGTATMFLSNGGLSIGAGYANIHASPSNGIIVQGNVGIGTTTPNAKLDVNGNAIVTGSLTVTNGITGSLFGTASTATTAATASTAPNYLPLAGGTLTGNQTISTTGGASLTIQPGSAGSASLNLNANTGGTPTINFSGGSTSELKSTTPINLSISNVPRLQANSSGVAISGSLNVTGSITGSLFGTSSWAVSASWAPTPTNGFIQGGNSFGTTALLGTNDNQPLALETNGSTRMFISSSGNVGIGTTSPVSALQVGADYDYEPMEGTSSKVTILSSTDSSIEQSVLRLVGPTHGGVSYPRAVDFKISRWEASGVSPRTQLNIGLKSIDSFDVSTSTNVMSLRDNGNVGIGITTPAAKLDIYDSTQGSLYVRTGTAGANWLTSATSAQIGTFTNHPFYIKANDATAIAIVESGNVGIGTTSPGANTKLQVDGSGLFTGGVSDPGDSTPAGVRIGYNTSGGYGFIQSIQTGVAYKPLVLQNPGGNVGIGTTDPGYKLDVKGTIFTSGSFGSRGVEDAYRIKFYDNGGIANDPGIGLDGSAGAEEMWFNSLGGFQWYLGTGGEKMRITSTGYVGIGTTSPSQNLDVRGNIALSATTASNGGYQQISFPAGIYSKAAIRGYSTSTADSGELRFYTAPTGDILTERVSIKSDGSLHVSGTSVFGTGTTRPTTIGGSSGTMYTQGDAGGWAFGHHAKGSSGTDRGGFGWLGNTNDLNYYYIGASYDTATMYVTSGSAGKVGIGTASPTSKLHIDTGVWSPTTPPLKIYNGAYTYNFGFTGTAGDVNAMEFYANSGVANINWNGFSDLKIGTSGNVPLTFYTNNSDKVTITGAGDVGIGKTTPNAKLDVNGNTIITGSLNVTQGITGSLFGNASTATSAATVLVSDNATYGGITFYPVFTSTTAAAATLNVDTSIFTYNPSTNTLTTTASYATTAPNYLPLAGGTLTGSVVITGSLRGFVSASTVTSNTASIDLLKSNFFTVALTNGVTTHISASNVQPGQTTSIRVTQASSGTGTVTFSSAFKQPSGSLYTASTANNAVDILSLISFDSTTAHMVNVKNLI